MSILLFRHMFRRTLRGKRLLGTAALASVAGIAAWVATASEPGGDDIYRTITSSVPSVTLSIAFLILATATLRDERDGGTLPYIYLTPVSATVFAVSSMAASVAASLTVAVIGWAPGWIGVGLTTGSWSLAVPALALYAAAALGYTAVFVPLGYLFDRSLIIGLGYIFVWEGILALAVAGLSPSSIWRIAMSVYADLDSLPRDALDVLGSVEPGMWGGLTAIALLLIVGTGVLTWAVRSRDAV